MVEYAYDTWGKKVTTTGSLAGTLGLFQPFRYRGYVYDFETGFYYLQSRYYDPTTGRFISADILLSTGQGVLGHNCYAYCLGNPVGMVDTDGHWGYYGWTNKENVEDGGGGYYSNYGFDCRRIDIENTDPAENTNFFNHLVKLGESLIGKIKGTFSSYSSFVYHNGPAGEGMEWHHLVEQCQASRSGFDSSLINDYETVTAISKETHLKISRYYNTRGRFFCVDRTMKNE